MKNPGVFAVSRNVFDHPVFRDEPFTEREAWLWMISAAAFSPMRTRVGKKLVSLQRGQLAFAERFMADKFGWAKTRVHRFIARLESEAMVDRKADRDLTILTICNYDKYAFDGDKKRTTDEPQNGPQTDRKRTKEEELKELKEEHGGEVRAQALAIAERIESLCGYPDPKNIPPGFCGGPNLVEKWLRAGWRAEIIIPAVQEALARKRDGPPDNPIYFEKPIARAHARHAAPLPQVKPGVSNESVGRGSGPAASWQASRDDWRSALADLKRTVAESETDGQGGDGSERGGQIIQLAAPARRG